MTETAGFSQIILLPPPAISPNKRVRRGSSEPNLSKLRDEIIDAVIKDPREWSKIAK